MPEPEPVMRRPAPLLAIGQPDPASRIPYTGWPLFALGFRPFYLLAAGFAVIGMAAWAALLLNWLPAVRGPVLAPLFWHAHEMVFGFAAAAVVGFLLTAGKNWTGLQTPQGPRLAGLAALWVAGFAAYLWKYAPYLLAPRVDGRDG
uniref:NnrS family protein n=1 Tax=Ralstonia syzygii R24 TaxID=907261 RepID=G3ABX2_9RALS|nr:membrane hypothetical protein [Ralstonia syzygii R24]